MLFVGTRYDGIWRRSLLDAVGPEATLSPRAVAAQTGFKVAAPERNGLPLKVDFTVKQRQKVSVDLFGISGIKQASLVDRYLGPGAYRYSWSTRNAAPGCYTVRVRMGTTTFVKSVPVVR